MNEGGATTPSPAMTATPPASGSTKKKSAAGPVVAVLFILIIGVVVGLVWHRRQKSGKGANEKVPDTNIVPEWMSGIGAMPSNKKATERPLNQLKVQTGGGEPGLDLTGEVPVFIEETTFSGDDDNEGNGSGGGSFTATGSGDEPSTMLTHAEDGANAAVAPASTAADMRTAISLTSFEATESYLQRAGESYLSEGGDSYLEVGQDSAVDRSPHAHSNLVQVLEDFDRRQAEEEIDEDLLEC
jgi:hypothetical protein